MSCQQLYYLESCLALYVYARVLVQGLRTTAQLRYVCAGEQDDRSVLAVQCLFRNIHQLFHRMGAV